MKKRESNFELLRIISMFLILLGHCFEHTIWTNPNNVFSNILININKLSYIGVTCFMLITGYFQCKNERKNKNIFILWLQLLFYSLGLSIIFYFLKIDGIKVGILDIATSIFPIIFKKYWFITSYIIVYLISPYLNKFIQVLSREEYKRLLMILTILFVIIPTFFTTTMGLSETGYLIYLYFIGAYIRFYYPENRNKFKYLFTAIACIFLYYLSVIIFSNFAYLSNVIYENIDYLFELNKLPTLICSISLFLFIRQLKIKSNFINQCASATLGVYLIHDNVFVREFLWNHIVRLDRFYNSIFLAFYGIGICIIIFIVCIVIEMIRKKCLEKRYINLIKKVNENGTN